MNEIVKYKFEGREVRIDSQGLREMYVAKDVCDALGIANVSDALSRLDDDEKDVVITDTLGGPQEMSMLTEAGMYKLTFRSRKPAAKRFVRWVTHEVLPAIRATGAYSQSSDRIRMLETNVIELMRRVCDRPNGLLGPGAKDLRARIQTVADQRQSLCDPYSTRNHVENEVRMIVGYPKVRGAKWEHCPAEVATRAHSYVAGLIETLGKRIAKEARKPKTPGLFDRPS